MLAGAYGVGAWVTRMLLFLLGNICTQTMETAYNAMGLMVAPASLGSVGPPPAP
jgi:hypothetical protein